MQVCYLSNNDLYDIMKYMRRICTYMVLVCLGFFTMPQYTYAVVKPIAFGGQITAMTVCTCSGNLLLYVKDVRGPVFPLIYQPGATMLYKWYQPRSGVWGLGQFVGGGVCLVYAGTSCVTGGTPVGTMIQLGTSMTIATGK
jgi:hypothetical protein